MRMRIILIIVYIGFCIFLFERQALLSEFLVDKIYLAKFIKLTLPLAIPAFIYFYSKQKDIKNQQDIEKNRERQYEKELEDKKELEKQRRKEDFEKTLSSYSLIDDKIIVHNKEGLPTLNAKITYIFR